MFYQEDQVTEIVEKKQFSNFFVFLNTLGGALALWLGISFVAFFEVVEWIVRLIIAIFKSCLVGKKVQDKCGDESGNPGEGEEEQLQLNQDPHNRPV